MNSLPQAPDGQGPTDSAAQQPAAALPERGAESLGTRLRDSALSSNTLWIFLALVAIIVVFSVLKPTAFLSSYDIKTIFINAAVALILSVGMTFVIITAGIDLSVGSILVMSGVIAVKVMIAVAGGSSVSGNAGWGTIVVGIVAGLGVGLGLGALNGVMIALLRVPPLITPQPSPTPRPATMPTRIGPQPALLEALAPPATAIITLTAITPDITRIDPTDRSMPAVMITNVIPTDRISATAALMKIVLMS